MASGSWIAGELCSVYCVHASPVALRTLLIFLVAPSLYIFYVKYIKNPVALSVQGEFTFTQLSYYHHQQSSSIILT